MAVPYVEVSATAPPPADIDVGVEGAGGDSGGNVLTSVLFGSGKDSEEAPSSTVEAAGGSPDKDKEGGVMNFFEKVAVAVGLVSSDDEDEETAAAKTTSAAADETTTAAVAETAAAAAAETTTTSAST